MQHPSGWLFFNLSHNLDFFMNKKNSRSVNIGLIFSTSGTTSIVEEGQLQAGLLAIDESNRRGRLHFKAVIEDIKSNPQVTAEKAHKLLQKDRVDLLVGCWTSACRKAVLPVLEETGGLLLYPNNYEGQEAHPQVFYLGAVPNQQVETILSWVVGNLASRFILLGSDYIYPRSANQQVRHWVERIDPQMIALERYFPLGHSDFGNCIDELRPLLSDGTPTVIFSNLVGSSVVDFYRQYHQAHFSAPIISPITSEREIAAMGTEAACHHYCTSSYFQSLNNAKNQRFVNNYATLFGETTVNGAMEFAYNAIHLLEQAYDEKLLRIDDIASRNQTLCERLRHISLDAPQGKIIVDHQNQHMWLWSRIGKVRANGHIDIVWSSPGPIPPSPFSQVNSNPDEFNDNTAIYTAFNRIVGTSPLLQDKIRIAMIAAKTQSNVLISGESGVGKGLFARSIHEGSSLANRTCIEVNCRQNPKALEQELFGDSTQQNGALNHANQGTLLLKDICEMSLACQQRLLDTLQTGSTQVGKNQQRPLQLRIIATTCRDLPQEIAYNGTFNSTLYEHLAVFNLPLPALREHAEDIPALATQILDRLNLKNNSNKQLASTTLIALQSYSWPGNIRELINSLNQAYYLSLEQKIIHPQHLPKQIIENLAHRIGVSATTDCLNNQKNKGEKEKLEEAFQRAGYNMSRAAKQLGISRSTLYRKIEKYGIPLKSEIITRS
jgi:DNA-binding NtrC family response regulator/ABC-type branched-subunit amino acid transport system substrate-binding protein